MPVTGENIDLIGWLTEGKPLVVTVIIGLLVLVWLWSKTRPVSWVRENLIWRTIPDGQRDTRRAFTEADRRNLRRYTTRCEGGLIFRCRETWTDADHWFPHSRGGYTDAYNLVGLCGPCNGSKSDKVPTILMTKRLQWRRRGYFPVDQYGPDVVKISGRRAGSPFTDPPDRGLR